MFLESVRSEVLQWVKPIHRRLRGQKTSLFLQLVGDCSEQERLLDVGGALGIDREFGQLYSRFKEAMVVNLDPQNFDALEGSCIKTLVADGRNLPFETASIDWVFSNAVIEHVGQYEEQARFANEIRRVAARGYFVACQNKYFPIEPHTLLPFYQFLPRSLQRKVAPYSPGYLRQYEEINLLTRAQLQRLFPEARVRATGFPLLGNSIVAYYKKEDGIK